MLVIPALSFSEEEMKHTVQHISREYTKWAATLNKKIVIK